MHVTYLGHACYAVEVEGRHILVDPLLTDTLQCGTAAVHPPRHVAVERMPELDAIIITHVHPGHLEIASLALLPRHVPIFYPHDHTIEFALHRLGFDTRIAVAANQEIDFGDFRVVTTGSHVPFAEIGCLFEDISGATFWYPAESIIDAGILETALHRAPRIDFMVCNYPGYRQRFFTNMALDFPVEDLQRSLDVVVRTNPALVVPNFAGIRYIGDAEWINRFMFPMTHEHFLDDLHRLVPGIASADLWPGDVVTVRRGACKVEPQGSAFVSTAGERARLDFDPARALPPLTDPNPEGTELEVLAARVEAFLTGAFTAWLQSACTQPNSLPQRYQRLGICSRIAVVYPSSTEESWLIDLAAEPMVTRESRAVQGKPVALGLRIAASVLDLWYRAEVPYYYVYCFARPYGTAYRTSVSPDGSVSVDVIPTRHLIAEYLSDDVEHVYHRWIEREVARYGDMNCARTSTVGTHAYP